MAKYRALTDTWISHECRLVRAGDEFDTTFPEKMKLGSNLELVEPSSEPRKRTGGKSGEDLV